ncbi:MAG: copper amine oxidase N-terminal domain-containing protein [Thermacetogeniaceae bacterium]
MLRARKRWISLLVTLAMLVTLIVPVGTAFAAGNYAKITGTYKYLDDDKEQQLAGVINVVYDEDFDPSDVSKIYVEVNLETDGVTFNDVDSDVYGPKVTVTGYNVEGTSDTSFTFSIENPQYFDFTIENLYLDIDDGVSGNVVASVRVWGVKGDDIVWDTTDNVTIAKIKSGNITVTADDPKNVDVGSDKEGAKITIKELSPGALTADDASATDNDIFLTIKNSNVSWDLDSLNATHLKESGVKLLRDNNNNVWSDLSNSARTLHLKVGTGTTVINGKIELTPVFTVKPGASGDIVVKVSGDDVPTTEVTVAKIGRGNVDVTVDNDSDDTVYLGQKTTMDDVTITLEPNGKLDEDDYITITLPKGLKWQTKDDDALSNDSEAIKIDGDDYKFNSIYNDDRTIWIDVVKETDSKLELSELKVKADADAKVGDLIVTFGGAVSGEYKIGNVKAPFTITAEQVTFPQKGTDVPGGKITITEAADGALWKTDNNHYLDIVLPIGFSWARTPDIDVTEGDIDADIYQVDDNILRIVINEISNEPSTIELSDIYYDIDNRAATGDVVAKVGKEYNQISEKYIATVKLGTIVSPTAATAVLKIGDPTITINGVAKTMEAAPYIKDGRTFIPVRYAANAVGVSDDNILWDGASKKVTILKGDRVVQMTIGSNVMTINGAAITMDVAPEIVAGRTMLPVRFVAQALGANITWDEATQTVTISVQ